MVAVVELSDDGANFIAAEEGERNDWYQDSLGTWTIGIGHVWNPSTDQGFADRSLSDAEVWDLFIGDVQPYVASVNDTIDVPLTQAQFDCLVSFAFNWGISPATGFPATSVVKLINAEDFAGAAVELVDGKGPSGRRYDKGMAGVRNRRVREAEPFRTLGGAPMKFVSRAQWGARSASTSTNITPDGVAVHWEGPHIGSFPHSSCAALVRGIQAFHMDTRGWADLAYSAIGCPHGYVFEGRGPGHRTAANGTDDGNQRFYAVCFLGGEGDEFTLAAGLPAPGRHDDALATVLDHILLNPVVPVSPLGRLAVDDGSARQAINDAIEWLGGGEICGHRDITATECPGDEIYDWVHSGHPSPGPGPVPTPTPDPVPDPEEDDSMKAYLLYNWGGAVFLLRPANNPIVLTTTENVLALLAAGATPIGDVNDAFHRDAGGTVALRAEPNPQGVAAVLAACAVSNEEG